MWDKYTLLTIIITIIGLGIMIYHQTYKNDDVLWLLFIPLGIMVVMKIMLKREIGENED